MTQRSFSLPDEIDIRPVIRPLLRWWWVVILAAIAGAAIAAVQFYATPDTYESRALVYSAGPRTQLNTSPVVNTQPGVVDTLTLQQLANSPDLLGRVVTSPALAGYPDGPLSIDELARKTQVSRNTQGSPFLELRVRDADPQWAARIAQEWGLQLARLGNIVLSTGEGTDGALDEQVTASYQDFLAAQDLLERDLANPRLLAAQNELRTLQGIVAGTVNAADPASFGPAGNQPATTLPPITQVEAGLRTIGERTQEIERGLAAIPGLRAQVQAGGDPVANRLGLQAIVTAVYGPAGVEISLPGDTRPVTPADVDAVAAAGRAILADLARLRDTAMSTAAVPATLYQRIATLDAEVSGLQARRDAALEQRDAAYRAWTGLVSRREQARASSIGLDTRVQLAASAVAPSRPVTATVVEPMVQGAVVGAIAGLVLIYGIAIIGAVRTRNRQESYRARQSPA